MCSTVKYLEKIFRWSFYNISLCHNYSYSLNRGMLNFFFKILVVKCKSRSRSLDRYFLGKLDSAINVSLSENTDQRKKGGTLTSSSFITLTRTSLHSSCWVFMEFQVCLCVSMWGSHIIWCFNLLRKLKKHNERKKA